MQKGFSSDGFITDQDYFGDYPYRAMTSDINGCGWMAAYDLRRALGQDVEFDDVRRQMDAMFLLRIPGPTTMAVMLRYLRLYIDDFSLVRGRAAVLSAAPRARAGILRYTESGIPHFAAFVNVSGDVFRFFNVADGLEDCRFHMAEFILSRCKRGCVRAILVF